MKIRLGCDLVFIPRFQKIIDRTPAVKEKIFSSRELEEGEIGRLAGFFAAKEATMKALSLTPGSWRVIEIFREESGRPRIEIQGESMNSDLSISHDGDYVISTVIFYES